MEPTNIYAKADVTYYWQGEKAGNPTEKELVDLLTKNGPPRLISVLNKESGKRYDYDLRYYS
jgi:hypothetical protein